MPNPNLWLDCDDEMKMGSFLKNFTDETALRKFALLNALSVTKQLVDMRSCNAIRVAERYLNGEIAPDALDSAYQDAGTAHDDLIAAHMSDDDPTESEALTENAAMIAMWSAYPIGFTGITPLESARDAALHTAYYCFQINGLQALEDQIPRFRESGLIA